MSVLADMSLTELRELIELYPWFAAAREELAVRLSSFDNSDGSEIFAASLYCVSRRKLRSRCCKEAGVSFRDPDLEMRKKKEESQPKVIVVGGDYFSSEDLENVSSGDDYHPGMNLRSSSDDEQGMKQSLFNDCLFYTETLAKIYADQGYFDRAEEVYTKLSLLYPEKSAYFASLIEKMKS